MHPTSGFAVSTAYHTPAQATDYIVNRKLAQIESHSDQLDSNGLASSLNELCGPNGHAEVNMFKGNFQVHLFFSSKAEREEVMKVLTNQFAAYNAPQNFQEYQLVQEGNLFTLKLATNQSAALIGKDARFESTFKLSQQILKDTKEAFNAQALASQASNIDPFPCMELPLEVISNIITFLPLKTIGNLAQTCHFNCELLSDKNNFLWNVIAENLNIPINSEISDSPKNHIKNYEFDLGIATIYPHLKTIKMKNGINDYQKENFFKDVFEKYVPKGYFLEFYAAFGSHTILYWKDNGEVGTIITPGRMCEFLHCEGGYPGFKNIMKNNQRFNLIVNGKIAYNTDYSSNN